MKTINIIGCDGKTYRINNGGFIQLYHDSGTSFVACCKYIDETHFSINDTIYSAEEFKCRMEQVGISYEPIK